MFRTLLHVAMSFHAFVLQIESISGDWLTDSSYKGINHGMDLNWHVRYQPETYGAGNVPVKLPINILGVIGILAVLYTAKICFFV